MIHNYTPLSMPLSLDRGEYTSPSFTITMDDDYGIGIPLNRILDGQDSSCMQGTHVIDSTNCQGVGRILDADWELVNRRGKVISRGTYKDWIHTGTSSEVWIGRFQATWGERLKFILRIHQDIQGYEAANPRLEIHGTEDAEGLSGQFVFVILWAFVWASTGVTLLLILKNRRAPRQKPPTAGSD
jgi:hypothetical protein